MGRLLKRINGKRNLYYKLMIPGLPEEDAEKRLTRSDMFFMDVPEKVDG